MQAPQCPLQVRRDGTPGPVYDVTCILPPLQRLAVMCDDRQHLGSASLIVQFVTQGSRYPVARSLLASCFYCALIKLTSKVAHIVNVLVLSYPLEFVCTKKHIFIFFKTLTIWAYSIKCIVNG